MRWCKNGIRNDDRIFIFWASFDFKRMPHIMSSTTVDIIWNLQLSQHPWTNQTPMSLTSRPQIIQQHFWKISRCSTDHSFQISQFVMCSRAWPNLAGVFMASCSSVMPRALLIPMLMPTLFSYNQAQSWHQDPENHNGWVTWCWRSVTLGLRGPHHIGISNCSKT